MHARSLLAAAAMLVLFCGQAAARDLSVVVRPPGQEAIDKVFIQPFTTATGIPVQAGSWEGGLDTLRAQVTIILDKLTEGPSLHTRKRKTSHAGRDEEFLTQTLGRLPLGLGPRTAEPLEVLEVEAA